MKKQIIKQIITLLLGSTLFMPITEVFAIDEGGCVQGMSLAKDVFIDGLYDQAILYTEADLNIKGYVDNQATQKAISWQITGNKGIIDFEESGNHAKITGKVPGTVWIMARATDGSDKTREFAVNVNTYPKDPISQSLIGKNITPILKRPFQYNTWMLRVEVSKNLVAPKEREEALITYLKKLASSGTLSNQGISTDEFYEYYVIDLNTQKIEVRLSKSDQAYCALKNILSNVNQYNSGKGESGQGGFEKPEPPPEEEQEEANKEAEKQPEVEPEEEQNLEEQEKPELKPESKPEVKPEEESNNPEDKEISTHISVEDITQGIDQIIIVGGSGTSLENPVIVTLEEGISSTEKIETMEKYLEALRSKKNLSLVKRMDRAEFTSYVFRVSQRVSFGGFLKKESKNDFFIEIRVTKEDQEAYIPIIEMLDDTQKKELTGIDDKNTIKPDTDVVESDKDVLENYQNIIEEYQQVLQANPEELGTNQKVIQAYKQVVEALEDYKQAVENDQGVVQALDNYKKTLERHKEILNIEKFLEMDTKQLQALNDKNNQEGPINQQQVNSIIAACMIGLAWGVKRLG